MTKRVLVIDDEADVRRLMRRIMENEGYAVREMESANHLEVIIGEFSPDLILCDITMPGRDGFAVCRSVQSDPQTRSIPVVLVSARMFQGDKRAALEAGAAGYIVKPFDPATLVTIAREAIAEQIRLQVWGCRGSIPVPERALGCYGGNTPCVDVLLPGRRRIIFDAGTGIRGLGQSIEGQSPMQIALLLTHFHWDHILGLPFFAPLYVPGNEVYLHGPADDNDALMEKIVGQMGGDYFPVSVEAFQASVKYVAVQEQSFETLGTSVSALYAFHPCRTLAYRIDAGDRSIVYAPDNEILPETTTPELSSEARRFAHFASGASLLIHDCTYSRPVYEQRRGWGHSCGATLAAVAAYANVKRVLLFHHDPDSSDDDVEEIHREFWETCRALGVDVPSEPAREGAVYEV